MSRKIQSSVPDVRRWWSQYEDRGGEKRTGATHTLVVGTYSGWSDSFPFKDIKSILQWTCICNLSLTGHFDNSASMQSFLWGLSFLYQDWLSLYPGPLSPGVLCWVKGQGRIRGWPGTVSRCIPLGQCWVMVRDWSLTLVDGLYWVYRLGKWSNWSPLMVYYGC